MTTIKSITDKEALDLKLSPTEELTILDFYATWCHPCRYLLPILEEFSGQYNIVKVDVDRCTEAVASYGVRGVPALVAIKNGKVLDTSVGNKTKQELQEWLSSVDKQGK